MKMTNNRFTIAKIVILLGVLTILTGCSENSVSETGVTKSISNNKLLSSWCKVEAYGKVQPIRVTLTKLGVIIANSTDDSISGVLPIKCNKAKERLSLLIDNSFEITFTEIPMLSGVISIKSETAQESLDSGNESITNLRRLTSQFSTARLYADSNGLNFEIVTAYPVFDTEGAFLDDDKITILIRNVSILLADAVNENLTSVEFKSNS